MLNHKIGLITADEITIAGSGFYGDSSAYLYTGIDTWLISPEGFTNGGEAEVSILSEDGDLSSYRSSNDEDVGLRPMVSLKAGTKYASGTGTTADPYIVE